MMQVDPVERHLFLEGIFLRYGYDFRQYAETSLNRRLVAILVRFKADSLLDVLKRVLASPEVLREVLPSLTISTTEFFRDPAFFRSLRENVFPVLKTYPKVVVWLAGCSTGEEVLSMAIALKEENLLKRTVIHATDLNPAVLKVAKNGIYELNHMATYNRNYVAAGGSASPSDYYTAEYGLARFDPSLLQNVVFSEHNLATDAPFVEAHLILCRNVLIYFDRTLQDRALQLFARSLIFKGFLGIGSKESLRMSSVAPLFDPVDAAQHLYALKTQAVVSPEKGGVRA